MPTTPVSFTKLSNELRDDLGNVVGITDRACEVKGQSITFGDVLVKGDLSGNLEYNGVRLRVVRVNTMIGLEVTMQGARGPVWKDVECEVIR